MNSLIRKTRRTPDPLTGGEIGVKMRQVRSEVEGIDNDRSREEDPAGAATGRA
jgi:hypothetical protein